MSEKSEIKIKRRIRTSLLDLLSQPGYRPLTALELQKKMQVLKKRYFHEVLGELIEENLLSVENGLILRAKVKNVLGTIRIHSRGFGFVQDDRMQGSIFIPKPLTGGAVDGDRVEVEIKEKPKGEEHEKGPEGRVVAIVERARSYLAGTVVKLAPPSKALLFCPLLGKNKPLLMLYDKKKPLAVGDRVTARVEKWGSDEECAEGSMVKYIGSIEDPKSDFEAIVETYDLPRAFPEEALSEAERFGTKVRPEDLKGREDLRELECFTIDPETARDFDDAISLSKTPSGGYLLGVHIADVSHYVKSGSALDKEARHRCNSIYLPGTVVPMLPHALSSELCSLKPQVLRLTASVIMEFDGKGNLIGERMCRSVIRSQKRFTYPEAKEVIDGKIKSKHAPTLLLMQELCGLLKAKRTMRGSLELSVPQLKIKILENGEPQGFEIEEYDITHQLVEEFMLKANEVVATTLAQKGRSLTYRVHDAPAPSDLEEYAALAGAFGFKLSKQPSFKELQELLDQARQSPTGNFLVTAFIRTMRLAIYSVDNIGHYGLGLKYYTHFTSPIRRYIDLVIHRLLFDEIGASLGLQEVAAGCSDRERFSAKAEGEAIMLKKLRFLAKQLADHPGRDYQALVTEVKPAGIVFAVPEFVMEGFFPLSALEDDYYSYNSNKQQLIGKRHGISYKVGDALWVKPADINLITLEMRWALKGTSGESGASRQKRKPEERRKFPPKRKGRRGKR